MIWATFMPKIMTLVIKFVFILESFLAGKTSKIDFFLEKLYIAVYSCHITIKKCNP